MDPSEYLAFIPLLIYGLAIADLLSEWKRFLNKKHIYLPYIIMTIIFIEVSIYNVFIYINLVNKMQGASYLSYLKFISPPFLFLIMVKSFTPDKDDPTKEYFDKNKLIFFSLFASFIASHYLFNFNENEFSILGRIISICLVVTAGLLKKNWAIYILLISWFLTLLTRLDIIST